MTNNIRAYAAFTTNVAGLPDGEYMTETCYSDTYVWRVVRRTATTVVLTPVEVELDPTWRPNILPGGFAGHCTNAHEARWIYRGLGTGEVRARLARCRYAGADRMWVAGGREFIANGARRHHDYNF